jgi:hypothetical protein
MGAYVPRPIEVPAFSGPAPPESFAARIPSVVAASSRPVLTRALAGDAILAIHREAERIRRSWGANGALLDFLERGEDGTDG